MLLVQWYAFTSSNCQANTVKAEKSTGDFTGKHSAKQNGRGRQYTLGNSFENYPEIKVLSKFTWYRYFYVWQ